MTGGYSLVVVRGFLIVVASLAAEQGLQQLRHVGSKVATHGLPCPVACGLFPGQGLDLCFLHWQKDSIPLSQTAKTPKEFLFRRFH